MTTENLLLELGTEELPPKALRKLAQALHDDFVKHLNQLPRLWKKPTFQLEI